MNARVAITWEQAYNIVFTEAAKSGVNSLQVLHDPNTVANAHLWLVADTHLGAYLLERALRRVFPYTLYVTVTSRARRFAV